MRDILDIVTSNQEAAIGFLVVVGLLVLWAVLHYRRTERATEWAFYWPFQRVAAAPATTTTAVQPAPVVQTVMTVGPTIGITPNVGPEIGNQQVTLTGTGFHRDAVLKIGGHRATAVSVSRGGTRLTGRTPANDPGKVEVTITNPDGQSASLPNGYEYV